MSCACMWATTPALCEALSARAVTTGSHVAFAAGVRPRRTRASWKPLVEVDLVLREVERQESDEVVSARLSKDLVQNCWGFGKGLLTLSRRTTPMSARRLGSTI